MKKLLISLVFVASCAAQTWKPTPGAIAPPTVQGWSGLTACSLDGTYDACVICGCYENGGQGTKSIRNIGMVTNTTMTKTGGSALVFFLSDPSTSTGGPMQPDGTEDQTVAMSNGDIPAANTYFETANLSADRSVAEGEFVCAGVRFDASGRQGSDSLQIMRVGNLGLSNISNAIPGLLRRTTATGAYSVSAGSRVLMVYFKHSDGTYGWISRSVAPVLANTGTSITNASTIREHGLHVVLTESWRLDAVEVRTGTNNGAWDLVIYDSANTALRTIAIDDNYAGTDSNLRIAFPPLDLTAGQAYRIVRKPATDSAVTVTDITTPSADWITRLNPGGAYQLTTRDGSGTWTEDPVKLSNIFLSLSHIGVTASGGASSYPIQ